MLILSAECFEHGSSDRQNFGRNNPYQSWLVIHHVTIAHPLTMLVFDESCTLLSKFTLCYCCCCIESNDWCDPSNVEIEHEYGGRWWYRQIFPRDQASAVPITPIPSQLEPAQVRELSNQATQALRLDSGCIVISSRRGDLNVTDELIHLPTSPHIPMTSRRSMILRPRQPRTPSHGNVNGKRHPDDCFKLRDFQSVNLLIHSRFAFHFFHF